MESETVTASTRTPLEQAQTVPNLVARTELQSQQRIGRLAARVGEIDPIVFVSEAHKETVADIPAQSDAKSVSKCVLVRRRLPGRA